MSWIFSLLAGAVAAFSATGAAQAQGVENGSAEASRPIEGGGDWVLQQQMPGMPGRVCTIRSEGPEANVTIVINDVGRPVLILGRGDWSGLSGDANVSISIDGARPVRLRGAMVHNLVLLALNDADMVQRLREAETVEWTLPFGRFRTRVSGLSAAMDALAACAPDPAA